MNINKKDICFIKIFAIICILLCGGIMFQQIELIQLKTKLIKISKYQKSLNDSQIKSYQNAQILYKSIKLNSEAIQDIIDITGLAFDRTQKGVYYEATKTRNKYKNSNIENKATN